MFYTIKRKTILSVFVVLVLVCICTIGMQSTDVAQVYMGKSLRKVPIYKVDTKEKVVALTFDAAWGADKTQGILDILEKHGAKATFFLVGFWVEKYPEMVKTISDKGMEIGNHSKNHYKMSTLSSSQIKEELSPVSDKIKEITGKAPKVFRPPFGDYNNTLIDTVAECGMKTIQWSVDSLDWKGLGPNEMLARINKSVGNGGIILFHNNSEHILEALPVILPALVSQGYKFVKMSDLVYEDNYSIDSNGVQHRNV